MYAMGNRVSDMSVAPTGQHDPEAMRVLLLEWFRQDSRIDDQARAWLPLAALIERAVAVSG
jgi:hypothetical protein